MYARRQRRVQSGSTNVQTLVLTTLNPDEILCANLKSYPIQFDRVSAYTAAKVAERPRGRLQIYYTPVQIRTLASTELYSAVRCGEECNVLRQHLNQKTTRGDSGHSFRETPGLIPNPAVKPEHVVYCTEVRESSGTIPSCYHLSFYTVFLTKERSTSFTLSSVHYGTLLGS